MEDTGLPLVSGGILDQPEPLFSMVRRAGYTYNSILRRNEELKDAQDEAQRLALEALRGA